MYFSRPLALTDIAIIQGADNNTQTNMADTDIWFAKPDIGISQIYRLINLSVKPYR
jgi:hypothetical protein